MTVVESLSWHLVVVLLTPGLLAGVATLATALWPRPGFAYFAMLPAWLLSLAALRVLPLTDQLHGAVRIWCRPDPVNLITAVLLAAFVASVWRPSRSDARGCESWRQPLPSWQWCGLGAIVLTQSVLAVPILLPALLHVRDALTPGRTALGLRVGMWALGLLSVCVVSVPWLADLVGLSLAVVVLWACWREWRLRILLLGGAGLWLMRVL